MHWLNGTFLVMEDVPFPLRPVRASLHWREVEVHVAIGHCDAACPSLHFVVVPGTWFPADGCIQCIQYDLRCPTRRDFDLHYDIKVVLVTCHPRRNGRTNRH